MLAFFNKKMPAFFLIKKILAFFTKKNACFFAFCFFFLDE